jgi:hypothetical protein
VTVRDPSGVALVIPTWMLAPEAARIQLAPHAVISIHALCSVASLVKAYQSMTRLCLTLLGDFQARLGPAPPLRLRTRKTEALLAYLALPIGQAHSRDKVAALLWGERSPHQARSRLRETLFVLRPAGAAEHRRDHQTACLRALETLRGPYRPPTGRRLRSRHGRPRGDRSGHDLRAPPPNRSMTATRPVLWLRSDRQKVLK